MTLFAYGSLKDPKILRRLIGRAPKMQKAILRGSCLRRPPVKRWKKYWMAIPKRNSSVRGRLLLDLSGREIKKIDNWEKVSEKIWVRKSISVFVGGRRRRASAYIGDKKYWSSVR